MLYGIDPESFKAKELHEDTPLSKHAYSDSSLQLIEKHANGLVLDLGAGAKDTTLPNVIQLDIFRFPKTDIVARAEALPFKDNVFDGVVSQAVFEHLQYPDLAAAEIQRVCKVGADIKIDTAFLQPEHGYPNHFYNATQSGLKHWFRNFDIQWSGVEPYQHPCFALDWFLQVYINGIPEKQQNLLQQASFPDLLNALDHLTGRKVGNKAVTKLATALWQIPEPVQKTIAAGVSLSAKVGAKQSHFTPANATASIVADAQLEKLEHTLQSCQFQSQCWQWLWEIQQSAMEVLYDHLRTRHHPLLLGTSQPLWQIAKLLLSTTIESFIYSMRKTKQSISYLRHKTLNVNKPHVFTPPARLSDPPLFQFLVKTDKHTHPLSLLQCLCSLLKQSYGNWECSIQLTNGNSIISEIAWEFALRNNRFKVRDDLKQNKSFKNFFSIHRFSTIIEPHIILLPRLLEEFASLAVAYPDKQAIQCRSGIIKKNKIDLMDSAPEFTMARIPPESVDNLPQEKIGNLNKILFLIPGGSHQ